MLLSVQKITKLFPVQRGLLGQPTAFVKALNDVSFEVKGGEITGVVGESGCGKSTLGRCVVGLYPPTEGTVFWEGSAVAEIPQDRRLEFQRKFQMVFQNPFASLNPRQKIGNILLEPLEVHGLLAPAERLDFVKKLLVRVGLSEGDLEKYPHEFSGGQRQRIGLARALACQPDLIVLDEPVSSLDVSVQASILNLLAQLNREKKIAYLFISHDLQVVGYLSQRVLVMYLGKIVEQGNTMEVLGKPRHPYTQVLLAASMGGQRRIEGEPPDPAQMPTGCPFHPRCPYAEERCRQEKQELQGQKGGWQVACWKWDQVAL
jgi:oligopeptide/dipeptide ABC transporter ATP-binding protein